MCLMIDFVLLKHNSSTVAPPISGHVQSWCSEPELHPSQKRRNLVSFCVSTKIELKSEKFVFAAQPERVWLMNFSSFSVTSGCRRASPPCVCSDDWRSLLLYIYLTVVSWAGLHVCTLFKTKVLISCFLLKREIFKQKTEKMVLSSEWRSVCVRARACVHVCECVRVHVCVSVCVCSV